MNGTSAIRQTWRSFISVGEASESRSLFIGPIKELTIALAKSRHTMGANHVWNGVTAAEFARSELRGARLTSAHRRFSEARRGASGAARLTRRSGVPNLGRARTDEGCSSAASQGLWSVSGCHRTAIRAHSLAQRVWWLPPARNWKLIRGAHSKPSGETCQPGEDVLQCSLDSGHFGVVHAPGDLLPVRPGASTA